MPNKETKGVVDFHVHYNPLDVTSGKDAIDVARNTGVIAIALLARGQVSPEDYKQLLAYGSENGVRVIPGVEIATRVNGKRADLVCLNFDFRDPELVSKLGVLDSQRRERNSKIVQLQIEILESQGFVIEGKTVESEDLLRKLLRGEITEKAINLCKLVVENPENTGNLELLKKENGKLWECLNKSYSQTPNYRGEVGLMNAKFLYLLYFDFDQPGYKHVEDVYGPIQPNSVDIIELIQTAGGVALYSPEGKYDQQVWQKLQDARIDGIMGWHGGRLAMNNNRGDIPVSEIIKARKRGLLILGGSDFQGKDHLIGTGLKEEMYISPRRLRELEKYLVKNRKGHNF